MKSNIILTQLSTDEIRLLFREELSTYFNLHKAPSQQNQSTILSIDEVCEYAKISKSHCYKLTSQNQIPHSKKGKRLYFDKEEIDNWLLGNPVKTAQQIEQEANDYLKTKGLK